MPFYLPANQLFHFPIPILGLEPYEVRKSEPAAKYLSPVLPVPTLAARTLGWVGNATRIVETWACPPGLILKVADGSHFYISPDCGAVVPMFGGSPGWPSSYVLSELDRQILLGPALVLALALRGVWSLHASAAMFNGSMVVFLGESGQGKSTLAAYLAQSAGWRRVADDILPVIVEGGGVQVLPYFPQLKIPSHAQPAIGLPAKLPLKCICVLQKSSPDQMPHLQSVSPAQGIQSLLSHTAGTRMFTASLLAQHLEFCAHAAALLPAYRLAYPHRRDTLPLVRELLESIC